MIKTTTWRPDTCDCEVEYDWDTETSEDARVHTPKQFNRRCAPHQALSEQMQWGAVVDENRRKNIFEGIAVSLPRVGKDILDESGNVVERGFAAGVRFTWSFDVDRSLNVTLSGITVPEKSQLQTLADNRFGLGKVIIK